MKRGKWLLWALAALLLAGCSLARPAAEPEAGGDRFAGFFVVRENEERNGGGFYNNPCLTEYGADSVQTDQFGTLRFPREVLFAVEDEAGNYTFPGMEDGYSLFMIEKNEENGPVSQMVSNMAPGEEANAISYKDEGKSVSISGTVYCGPPQGDKDWDEYEDRGIWMCYRVYQTEDGRAYLDGSGNSFSGGGGMGYSETSTYAYTENGETKKEDAITVYLQLKTTPRLEKLLVTQFDKTNAVIRSDDLALREALPEIDCEPETAWVLVEEISKDGTVRTLYNVPKEGEDPVSHQVVLLDGEGLGRLACLTVR